MKEPPRPIRACLFDMDGLILDSEDLYTICTNTILAEYGKPKLPWDIKAQMQGRPHPQAGKLLVDWADIKDPDAFFSKVAVKQRELFPGAKPLPGVVELLHNLKRAPGLHLALATSSHSFNYELKTRNNAELFKLFPDERKVLGDDKRIPPGRGKPAPDIYLLALKTINDSLKEGEQPVKPEECLVFEDSVPGVEAGRRAGMQVVWCPHPGLLQEYKGREKPVLAGLTGEHKRDDIPPAVETPETKAVAGAPGEIDDGWGVFLPSLENFPYSTFGIKLLQ